MPSQEYTVNLILNRHFLFASYLRGGVTPGLLNGTPPFASKDPLEVIHSHLAEIPRHLSKLNPDIPEMIGDIVAKLILKEPEKRYQTGSGLVHDLNRCRDEYLNRGGVSSFPLGLRDYSGRISISSIMVGRGIRRGGCSFMNTSSPVTEISDQQ